MSVCLQGRFLYRGFSVQQGLCPGGSLSRRVSVQEGLCPGGSLSRGLCPGGVSVQGGLCPGGVSVQGGLCPGVSVQGGLCPGGSLSGGLCLGVSVQGDLCPGGLCLGVSVQGDLCPGGGGLCAGGSLSVRLSLYRYVRSVRILLECILVNDKHTPKSFCSVIDCIYFYTADEAQTRFCVHNFISISLSVHTYHHVTVSGLETRI